MLLLIPCLTQVLIDESKQIKSTKFPHQLHQHSLERLKKIGPLYPLAFKGAIEKSPEIRTKLETALKADKEKVKRQQDSKSASSTLSSQPKIQLKMNFSNFK